MTACALDGRVDFCIQQLQHKTQKNLHSEIPTEMETTEAQRDLAWGIKASAWFPPIGLKMAKMIVTFRRQTETQTQTDTEAFFSWWGSNLFNIAPIMDSKWQSQNLKQRHRQQHIDTGTQTQTETEFSLLLGGSSSDVLLSVQYWLKMTKLKPETETQTTTHRHRLRLRLRFSCSSEEAVRTCCCLRNIAPIWERKMPAVRRSLNPERSCRKQRFLRKKAKLMSPEKEEIALKTLSFSKKTTFCWPPGSGHFPGLFLDPTEGGNECQMSVFPFAGISKQRKNSGMPTRFGIKLATL